MEAKGTLIDDAEDVLLRAMRHRETERRVLLSLEDSQAAVGAPPGMLYLDPAWLIELVRRLTGHNLVDTPKKELSRKSWRLTAIDITPAWTLTTSGSSTGKKTLDEFWTKVSR